MGGAPRSSIAEHARAHSWMRRNPYPEAAQRSSRVAGEYNTVLCCWLGAQTAHRQDPTLTPDDPGAAQAQRAEFCIQFVREHGEWHGCRAESRPFNKGSGQSEWKRVAKVHAGGIRRHRIHQPDLEQIEWEFALALDFDPNEALIEQCRRGPRVGVDHMSSDDTAVVCHHANGRVGFVSERYKLGRAHTEVHSDGVRGFDAVQCSRIEVAPADVLVTEAGDLVVYGGTRGARESPRVPAVRDQLRQIMALRSPEAPTAVIVIFRARLNYLHTSADRRSGESRREGESRAASAEYHEVCVRCRGLSRHSV